MVPRCELGIYRVAIRISTGPRLFSHIDVSLLVPCCIGCHDHVAEGQYNSQLTEKKDHSGKNSSSIPLWCIILEKREHIYIGQVINIKTEVTFKLKCKQFAMRHLSLWLLFLLMYIETKEVTAITWRIVGKTYSHSEPCFSLHDTCSINELCDFGLDISSTRFFMFKVRIISLFL